MAAYVPVWAWGQVVPRLVGLAVWPVAAALREWDRSRQVGVARDGQ